MPVALRRVVSEALQHVDSDFLGLGVAVVADKQIVEHRNQVDAAPDGLDAPGLMIDPGEDEVDIFTMDFLVRPDRPFATRPLGYALRDLVLRALDAVAQAHGVDAAVVIRRPGEHGHGVCVVQKQRAGLGDLANVFTKVEVAAIPRWP